MLMFWCGWVLLDRIPTGNYEYIDVIVSSGRIFVDIDFRAQFELARASKQYETLLKMVPCIFVGRGERLKAIIKAMSEGAKLSLKIMGMHLPPWRKHSYLQAKWFSSYKRTTKTSVVMTRPNPHILAPFPLRNRCYPLDWRWKSRTFMDIASVHWSRHCLHRRHVY